MLVLVSAVTRQNWYFPATPNFFPSQLRQIQFEDKVREEIGVRQRGAKLAKYTSRLKKKDLTQKLNHRQCAIPFSGFMQFSPLCPFCIIYDFPERDNIQIF